MLLSFSFVKISHLCLWDLNEAGCPSMPEVRVEVMSWAEAPGASDLGGRGPTASQDCPWRLTLAREDGGQRVPEGGPPHRLARLVGSAPGLLAESFPGISCLGLAT